MKKALLLMMCGIASAMFCQAQKTGYSKGDNLLNIGIGVNSYYSGGIPIGASYEKGVTDDISIGANVDYLSYKYYSSYRFTAIYFGVRGSYHLNTLLDLEDDKIDLYAGATLGYRSFSWTDTYSGISDGGSYGSGIYLGAYAGGKYYFGKKTGVFAELGAIGSTNVRVGVAFKM